MGQINKHDPVKYFTAVTFQDGKQLQAVKTELEKLFSSIELISEVFSFDQFTNYYEEEMGRGLKKTFFVFSELDMPEFLAGKKVKTNKLESGYMDDDRCRHVNIDPGYITLSSLVLATTKNFSHRIYLQRGVFGDLHLMFSNKTFQSMPWTYPDYKAHIEFFNKVRESYYRELTGK